MDGYSKLNLDYVDEGVNRFLTGKKKTFYSSHYGVNGMIGFVVKDIDIDLNIPKIGTFFNLPEKDKFYDSNHDSLKLYHLMMNFSKNLL